MTIRICVLLLLGAFISPAAAMDPELPLLDEEPGVSSKLDGFKQAWSDNAPVQKALAKAEVEPARDRIHHALQALPTYRKATIEFERTGDNAEEWQVLADQAKDVYLRAHATYFLGRSLLARDDLEAAADALQKVRGRLNRGTPWTDESTFYLAYVYARLPELDVDEKSAAASRLRAHQLLKTLIPAEGATHQPPERVVEGAVWLMRELRGEGMGPLLELAKRMETIERMIERTKTGQGTQVRQEKVIQTIDKLIALMRQKEQQCGSGNCKKHGKACKKGGKKKGGKKKDGKKAGGEKNQTGAKESSLPGGGEKKANLNEQPREATSEAWGAMKKKEREKVVQFLKENFPTRYKELIERYYRALAEQDQ